MENVVQSKVLILDDDEITANLISKLVESLGHSTIIVHNGDEAWKKYLEMKPNLMISDINHPGIRGLELLKMIRKNDQLTPIIIVSGNSNECPLAHGANAYFAKPFDTIKFLGQMEVFLSSN